MNVPSHVLFAVSLVILQMLRGGPVSRQTTCSVSMVLGADQGPLFIVSLSKQVGTVLGR